VLYKVEKERGDTAAALSYFERYTVQDKGYLNDVSARALAYQTVQQHLLTGKLETEKLSKQNAMLRLQRALDAKAVETGRLYILMLLLVVAFIASWLYRLKRSQLRFKRLSHHDGLTGIFNHQHFIGEAARVLQASKKKKEQACLISIDLDYFKQVNDTHGHAMGDAVLKQTVAICQRELRPADLFGRLGGEEFGILLAGCSRDQGVGMANRIRVAIGAAPMGHEACVITISASVGLASTEVSGHDLQRLCKEADAALYRAKNAGRNRVVAHAGMDDLFGSDGVPVAGPRKPTDAIRVGAAELE
jgi:diguanylate cyclase (GGDEF)-like protein